MIERYRWAGGEEAMLRFGPAGAPTVIAAPALFEEGNRTRAFLVAILRALAGHGIASVLPELPGMGDSLVETEDAALDDWRAAFAAAGAQAGANHAVAIRGGALLTAAFTGARWQFAPVPGGALIRDMIRVRLAAERENGGRFDAADVSPPGPPVELAGNRLGRPLIASLQAATPAPADRTLRLDTDPADADQKVAGTPLWRRSEPGTDAALSRALADDIADWLPTCAG